MSEPQPSDGSSEALHESEEWFRGAFQYSPIGIGIVALDGRFVRVNPALCRIGGYSEQELLSRTFQDVVPAEELATHRDEVRKLLRGETDMYEREVRYRHKLGHDVWVRFAVSAIRRDGRIVNLLGQAEDISARKEAEERLRQAERLEAVGRLAGGVAHEFNNLLAVIGGFARHALAAAEGEPLRRDLREIVGATERAAEISRQLLAFGRDQPSRPRVLDLNEVVGGIAPMLRSLIRENLELAVSTAERPCLVRADGAQLERIILNLVVNARDAIPDTGRIEIATRQVDRGGPEPPAGEAPGTDAVALAVSDTGSGIDDETRRRLFDPFFTTKEPGAGTGLGLSIVYGLVDQLDGTVTVDSEPGHGATFTVFIPAVSESGGADVGRSSESEPVPVQGGEETVLVVEDDAALRSLVELILAEAGYSVLTAGDGAEALEVVDGGGAIDLVLTDSIMPRVSGSELIRRLAAVRPATRVLQMTGYSDLSTAGGDVIAKPFEPETLLRRVRQVLDGA